MEYVVMFAALAVLVPLVVLNVIMCWQQWQIMKMFDQRYGRQTSKKR